MAVPDRLDRYREMRDFSATPEPSGGEEVAPADGGPRFVVQEHHATALHWDLRLEHEGTLASWAVPKGIPAHPDQNNLAVQTEDHPLMYLDFHGDIPEGSYGAGQMTIWDRGTYEPHKFDEREVMVTFHGDRVHGRYVLFRTGGKQWMIHRMDPPEDPGRSPMPDVWRPMRPVAGPLPDAEEDFGFEVDFGGVHVVAAVQGGRVEVVDEDGGDPADRFPELRPFGRRVGALEVMLDVHIAVLGADGRPDYGALERRLGAKKESAIRRLAESHPALIVIGDLLWLEGRPVTSLSTRDRRRVLDELPVTGPSWRINPMHDGAGRAVLTAAAGQGLPGAIAKRLDSTYSPGEESPDWIRIAAG